MRRGSIAWLVVGLVLGAVGMAALIGDEGSTGPAPRTSARRGTDAKPRPKQGSSKKKNSGKGELKVTFRHTKGVDSHLVKLVRDSDVITDTADEITKAVRLPRDVEIVMGGDDDGPYYDGNDHTIQYPWSFVVDTRDRLTESGYTKGEELDSAIVDATRFILEHEVAHALIDTLDVPVVGREEDAADSFAAVLAVTLDDDGELVIAATDLFGAFADAEDEQDESSFYDSHSLDVQRYYALSCLVYGADTKEYANVVEDLDIDKDRLEECPDEWKLAHDSWLQLLDGDLRGDALRG
ncbi:MAG: hypothetical protein JWM98_1353 [Thermoleophilia bacterium]|nr:hypothetical protein [Thermoleophilia bacterium]